MTRKTPLPSTLTARAFATSDARAAGVSAGRLTAADLAHPFRGVHTPAAIDSEPTLLGLCQAYATRMSARHAFSHATAARLYGLPLPRTIPTRVPLDVASVEPARAVRAAGIVGHKVAAGTVAVRELNGIRLVSPVACWCQLATRLVLDDLIALGDALIGRDNPLATLEELHEGVRRRTGGRGARMLREALKWIRPGVASPRETRLRSLLARAGLPEPEINTEILDEFGGFLAIGDLVYPRYRVVVEYDGGQHRSDEGQYHHDIDRLEELMAAGWRVVRINKTHLAGRGLTAIARVRRALTSAGWMPSKSPTK